MAKRWPTGVTDRQANIDNLIDHIYAQMWTTDRTPKSCVKDYVNQIINQKVIGLQKQVSAD